jgi:hypothetical protein
MRLLLTQLFLVCAVLHSQSTSSVSGTVIDPAGRGVPAARVTVIDVETNAARSMLTNGLGQYQSPQMRPGFYRITVEKEGFKTLTREPVKVFVGTPMALDLTLEVGAVTERVTVEATGPSVNAVDATIGHAFGETEVQQLPFVARNPVNLLTLQPGFVFTGDSDTDLLFQGSPGRNLDDREGVVNGVRANQSNLTVDGVDANDWETQAALAPALPVTLDSVREFRVITTNATAVDGIAGGAQVALVTKSGTNDWHGNLRWYHRNTATSANAFFNNLSGVARPKLIRNIGGGSVGGPVKRDRLFFFVDYELRREASESTQIRTVPTSSFRNGILSYRSIRGDVVSLAPGEFRALDPAGLGVNPAVTRYLALFPAGNDQTLGDGLNTTGYRFNAPFRTDNNLYTTRIDYSVTPDGRHAAFLRGTLGDIRSDLRPQQFPGQPPAARLLNNSRGFVAGYTAQLRPALINTLRWGFTRVGVQETGVQSARYALSGGVGASISDFYPSSRANGRRIPLHDLRDDLTWVRGRHSLQFGANLRFLHDSRFTEANSFPSYNSNSSFCAGLCRDAYNVVLNDGNPANDPADVNRFVDSMMVLTGAITNASATFLANPKTGQILPAGSPQRRRFAERGFEAYVQDTWRLHRDVTLTLGLRYSYYTPIWETEGAMVRANFDVRDWWNQRQSDMAGGIPTDALPPLAWDLAGKANGKPAVYMPDKNNFAPRGAIAWSPNFKQGIGRAIFGTPGRSAVRAGFGVYYQRLGGALVVTQDRDGSPGTSTTLSSTTAQFGLATAPRFSGSCDATGCAGLPPLEQYVTPPTQAAFPFSPIRNGSTLGFLVDNHLVHPYSMNANLSVQREIAGGVVLEGAYVGTFGRQLVQRADFAQFGGDLRDPTSGQTLWQAQNQIADLIGADPFRPAISPTDRASVSRIAPIAFFENMMPNLPAFTQNAGLTPTQAFYVYAATRAPAWAGMLPALDVRLAPGNSPWNRTVDPQQDGWVLFHPQMRWMPAVTNYGASGFHSGQLSIRKNAGWAVFGLNYVFSKSMDSASAAENGQENSGAPGQRSAGQVPNAFNSKADWGISDFNLTHNFNAHWYADLPVGRGRRFGAGASRLADLLIGGWAWSGVWRSHSGLPISLHNGVPRSTNEVRAFWSTLTGPVERDVVKNGAGGLPNLFSDPAAVRAKMTYTRPGGTGNRNAVYGPKLFNIDLGVHKTFRVPRWESHRVQFRATAYNAFNNVNFFAEQYTHTASFFSTPERFGRLTETIGPRGGARELEFVLRYEF